MLIAKFVRILTRVGPHILLGSQACVRSFFMRVASLFQLLKVTMAERILCSFRRVLVEACTDSSRNLISEVKEGIVENCLRGFSMIPDAIWIDVLRMQFIVS